MSYQKNSLVVAYFSSNLFSEPCGVSIASLFESNKDFSSIYVYIVEDKISQDNKQKIEKIANNYGRTLVFISMPEPKEFFCDERFTVSTMGHTFGRMIIGQLLPEEVERVICIDSDMLILQSLQELWEMDMQNNYLAGVDSAPGIAMMKKSLNIEPGTLYCNGGLFMVNLKAVRDNNIENKYKEYIKNVFDQGKLLTAYEEEVMNKCAYPNIIRLHPKYNLMTVNLVMDYDSFMKFRNPVNYYSR
ncbi:MAG: glycosyltransferase family 8 protein, partial [Ruminiclostridium sp.]